MPRRARTVLAELPHHVVLRGNNRRRLFSRTNDYLRFIEYTLSSQYQARCAIHAMTMMANHVHLVVTPPGASSLSLFVKQLAQRYASHRNLVREGSGKLFEERFFSRPLPAADDMAIVLPYVDLNPVRSGQVVDGGEYPWSTFAIHAGVPERARIPLHLWSPSAWYLDLGASAELRAAAYLEQARVALANGDQLGDLARVAAIEALSSARYTMRLERPDRSSAV